jgi:hypothetical protein
MNRVETKSPADQLNMDDLLAEARKTTGLSDFGDTWFLEPLRRIVSLVNADGGLPSLNVSSMHWFRTMIADRLRLVDYVKRRPEALKENIDVVGVIIGLGRGGSTLLHRLVSASPQLTACRWWELINPLPLPGEAPGNFTERKKLGEAAVAATYENMPDMKAMHPAMANAYEEEILLLDRTFVCMMYPFYFNIPRYVQWMMDQDHSRAYEELILWLKVLQHQNPEHRGKRWFLKTGHHLLSGRLEGVLNAFPKAKALMTHRTLEEVLPSYCSNQSTMIQGNSNNFNRKEIGGHAIRWFKEALERMMEVRKKEPKDRFIDIFYKDVMTDPQGQFRRTLERMGMTCRAEDEQAAAKWMAENGRETHPRHHYKHEDFGMTGAEIAETFKFYHSAFLK